MSRKKKRGFFKKIGGVAKKGIRKVKKAGRTAVKAGKIAATAATMPAYLAAGTPKMLVQAARGKGLTFPGSKYIGPGNPMNRGTPTSAVDAAAYQHDLEYDRYLKSGKVSEKKLYGGYSDADERLLKKSKQHLDTYSGMATAAGMGIKKLGYKLGLSGKKIKDREVYGNPSSTPSPSATTTEVLQRGVSDVMVGAKNAQKSKKVRR